MTSIRDFEDVGVEKEVTTSGNDPVASPSKIVAPRSISERSRPRTSNSSSRSNARTNRSRNTGEVVVGLKEQENSKDSPKKFDDYDFIKEIPTGDMWEPIGDGPAKSFDFGVSGWTASMNVGHEFLQLTAPDSACGLAYVRGSFANDTDAILARAQRRVGGKSTFGLKVVAKDSGYELGRRGDEGLLNFRWPYIEFPLNSPGSEAGTCTKFTFVRAGIVYQVLRLTPGALQDQSETPADERNTKATGNASTGPQKRHGTDRGKHTAPTPKPMPQADRKITVRLGGRLRFGCPCQRKIEQQEGIHFVEGEDSTLTCTNSTYQQRLEMCLFVDGEAVNITMEKERKWGTEVDATVKHSVTLTPGKVTLIIGTFKFVDKHKDVSNDPLPTSAELVQELGAINTSEYATDRAWIHQIEEIGGADYFDTCPGASCLEQILGVTSVPVQWVESPPLSPVSPRSAGRRSGMSEGPPSTSSPRASIRDNASQTKPESQISAEDLELDIERPSVDYTRPKDPVTSSVEGQPEPTSVRPSNSSSKSKGTPPTSLKDAENSLLHVSAGTKLNGGTQVRDTIGSDDEDQQVENEVSPENDRQKPTVELEPSRASNLNTPTPSQISLPPSEISFHGVVEPEESALSEKKTKPEIAVITDSKFLEGSQPRDTDSKPQSPGNMDQEDEGQEEDIEDGGTVTGIALLGGILAYQYVDLQRSLWQLRFLVKVHEFFSLQPPPGTPIAGSPGGTPPLANEDSSSREDIRLSLINRIEYTLYHSLVWIIHVKMSQTFFSSPATAPFKNLKRPDCAYYLDAEVDNDRTLYPPIVIWYVIKNCRQAVPQSFLRDIRKNLVRLRHQYRGEEELDDPGHKVKLCILIWYFYGCLEKLYQEVFDAPDYDPFSTFTEGFKQKTKIRVEKDRDSCRRTAKAWQKKSEKAMIATRKHLVDSYSDEFEIVDRLAFLGIELGLVSKTALKHPSSCVYQARRRILERTATKELNPGKGDLAFQSSTSRMSTKAPWELTCLSHHSRLALNFWNEAEIDVEDVQLARNDYHRFMTSNFTYVGSWDLSKSCAETWWDLDATCVIQATRLDLRMRAMFEKPAKGDEDALAITKSPNKQPHMLSPGVMSPLQLAEELDAPKAKADSRPNREMPEDGIMELLKKQIAQQSQILHGLKSESDIAFEYDWTHHEPGPVLHPNEWVHSLDDTPHLFQSAQTKTVQLRQRLLKYLVDRLKDERKHKALEGKLPTLEESIEKVILQPSWSVETVADEFDILGLSYLSVANIEVWNDGLLKSEIYGRLSVPESVEREERDREEGQYAFLPFHNSTDNFNSYGPDADELALDLWLEYLDGNLEKDSISIEQFYDQLKAKFDALSPEEKALLQDENIRKLALKDYKQVLLDVLNDSLVDSSARFRIYYIQRCTPSIVRAFIYMWHTLAIDTFDDHFGESSNFFNTNKEVWITSITISYWSFKRGYNGLLDEFHEGRDEAPFPPKKVIPRLKTKERWWKKVNEEKITTKRIEERSSSLVISGDTLGNFWMCSVISSVLPEPVMVRAVTAACNSLKEFAHQPETARCLTFLYYLGLLCEYISQEYEDILKELTVVIKLGREVLKRGLEKTHAEDSIMRLKSMLWALEALRILDDRLGESLDTIDDAKVRMLKYISHGPGRRQEHLERLCQSLIEDFGKRYDRLASVHSKIEQKIVQITRYREGITAVSNLEDTHTALTQNDTVRILTYITIAYLPISFVAAVFSMDIVTSNNWSAHVFAGMTAAFLFSTLILARSLGGLIGAWEELVAFLTGWRGKIRGKVADVEDSEAESESEEEEIKIPKGKIKERNEPTVVGKDGRKGDDKEKGKENEDENDTPGAWPREYVRRRKTGMAPSRAGSKRESAEIGVEAGSMHGMVNGKTK